MKGKKGIAGGIVAMAGATVLAAALGLFSGNAVDTAGSPLSIEQAQQLHAQGVSLFMQALSWWPHYGAKTTIPSTRIDSLRNARTGGMRTGGYILLDPYSSGAEAVHRALDGLPNDVRSNLVVVAIDFEIPGEAWSAGVQIPYQTIVDALDELEREGFQRVLYTSAGEWTGHLSPANPPKPERTYLFNASWDGNPNTLLPYPFGGFTEADVILKQYHGDTNLAGVTVDLDSSPEIFPWEMQQGQTVLTPDHSADAGNMVPYVSGITVHFSDGGSWELAVQPPAGR